MSPASKLRQRLEESSEPSKAPDPRSRCVILKRNLDQRNQEMGHKKYVKIAPKPTNTNYGAANQAPICQRCQAQFQLFENINAEVAALKPAPNQFLLIESVHAVIANWSQCTNCPRSYPHDFKIDSTHRLKSGILDVNLDEVDKSLHF